MAESRVDYERHGRTYARHRRADPRIAKRIHAALGGARGGADGFVEAFWRRPEALLA
jgi:uncharacterized protein (DUF736 family)